MWQPIETAPRDQFLLLCGPSGYTTTPMVVTTGRMCSDYHAGRWIDHANDDLTDWGFEPTHWAPLDLPGAQPAPSAREGWKLIPEKHPTFDLVDLKLADGSILCGCVPQSDGDYWWEGPSGEVFIDPKYAPATHWRLAVAPEAKP